MQTLSETILALILLDNLTLADALALFLSQRSKAVRDILHHHPDTASSTTSTAGKARRRSSVASRDKEQIGKVLKEAVTCLLDTVTLSQAVFDKRRKLDNVSLIEEMVKLVQKADTAPPPTSQQTPVRRTSHERRASRLASISSPLPTLAVSTTGSPVSAQKVLQTLPSSQILLRHLPATITTFTPFITPSPAPPVSERLADWRSTSISTLAEAVPAWLAALQSIQDVWAIRASLLSLLDNGDFEVQIRNALETQWAERVKAIWSIRLDSLVETARTKIDEGIEKLSQSAPSEHVDAASFAFSDLSYPAIPTAALASGSLQTTSLAPFLSSLQQRSSGRTPLLHDTLSALEGGASKLQKDVSDLSAGRAEAYQADARAALDRLVQVLEQALEGLESVEASLHVGRIAMYLASTSSLLSSLMGSDKGNGKLYREKT